MTWALALLSSALLILIHPGPALSWIAWVALGPLVLACALERRAKYRFLFGWTAGVVYWFAVCNWIQFVLEFHGRMGFWGGWGSFLLFCVLKAIHLGVFAWLAGFITGRWWSPVAIAALWVGLERTHGTFGFAWLALGNAGIDMGPLLRVAPLVGVYGLSFIFATVAAALACRRYAWIAVPLVIFVLPPLPTVPATGTAAVIQPNLAEDEDWTTVTVDRMEQRLVTRSLDLAVQSRTRLIIWPESPGPLYYFTDPRFKQYATDLARTAGAYFLFGTVGYTAAGAPLNSAVMLSPGGELVDRYDKMYLVPFGEFIPPMFGFVNRITQEVGDFVPGNRVVIFPAGDRKIGVFICYESAFPHLVRQFRDAGLYINISNDGYFGRSYARQQHLSLVRMRAVENRRWIVRSTNDGITATIDPAGAVTQQLEPYKETAALMNFGYSREPTPYAQYGDWFAWACLILSLSACIGVHLRPFKSSRAG